MRDHSEAQARSGKALRIIVSVVMTLMLIVPIATVLATEPEVEADFGPGKYTAQLLAGATQIDIGDVEVYNDQHKIYINVFAEGYLLETAHIYLGAEPIPLAGKSTNPAIGNFPYKYDFETPQSEIRLELDLKNDLGIAWGRPYEHLHIQNIAVHVTAIPENSDQSEAEGAWAEGPRQFDERRESGRRFLGTWFTYKLEKPGHGRLIDSPVGGLGYKTATYGRDTDESGSFLYYPGEIVDFELGGMSLGNAYAAKRVTPLDLLGAVDVQDIRVGNMARLLQSLDVDGVPKDRIMITPETHAALAEAAAELGVAEFDFENSAMIEALIDATIAKTVGLEGHSLVKISTEDALANLIKTLENSKFQKNISKTPDMYTTKSRIEIMPIYMDARTSQGELTTVEYHDEFGDLLETRDEAKPLICIYLDEQEGTGGALDVMAAISRDDGNTWKRSNLSRHADRSSFTLADGTEYMGTANKPSVRVLDNMIHVVWTSSYARSGSPRFSIKTEEDYDDPADNYPYDDPYAADDIWGVSGPQRSTDYTELGYPEVGEIPYDCVWSARGMIDEETGDITWFKPERLTSGRRNAMQLTRASANGLGFAITWQEDPEGIRPGSGKGPGLGWSGAIASHGTDIWYSYISLADFAKIDENFESNGDPENEYVQGDGRPKSLVPMALPVRISDNETLNSENIKVELDGDGFPIEDAEGNWIPIMDEDDHFVGTHRYGYEIPGLIDSWYEKLNNQDVLKQVAVTEDGRLMEGNVGGTRPTLFLQPYTKPDGTKSAWAVLGYEESKGLGDGGNGPQEEDGEVEDGDGDGDGDGIPTNYKPEEGKNIIYHSFDWTNPDLVSAGTILNPQAVDPLTLEPLFVVDELGEQILDWKDEPVPARENARRPRFMIQPKSQAIAGKPAGTPGTSLIVIFKMGEEGCGGPSDVFIRRWEVSSTDKGNPYDIKYLQEGLTNVSSITPTEFWENPDQADEEDKGIKLVRWTQDAENLNDYSWEYDNDNAQGHRGFLRGDFVTIGYDWTGNWRSARNGNDVYNLYIRRSFDGGKTFTTTPEELGGVGTTWSELFKIPQTGEVEEYALELDAGEFEPARNVSRLTNNKVNIIEPRLVPMPGTVQGSPYPEDIQDRSTIWLFWGTGAVYAQPHGDDDETEDVGKFPLDLQYTYSQDYGDNWVLEEKTINEDSDGNHAGDTVFRPYYLAKGDSSQGEAQVRFSPDGSRAFVVWNDEGPLGVGDLDVHFRRLMPATFPNNVANIPVE